jgi:5S rRNA maturation endonuclease (ribonuclease M5)
MAERIALGWKNLPTFVLREAGVTVDGRGRVFVPYRDESGEPVNRRVFAGDRAWWERRGRSLIPFGLDRLEDLAFRKYRCLAICEGESDSLALSAALGAEGLDVLGVPGASTWRAEWAAHADGYAAVFVFGDGDPAGVRFNLAVKHDLPDALAVWLPKGEDVRSIVQHNAAELVDLIAEAERLARFLVGDFEAAA